ncbi:MLN64 N-terminal [Pitangus sulphuratus]|nr:MLN64 N-terminal [Pitangus sulphuratus]
MNRVPGDAENAHSSSVESCPSLRDVHSINPAQLMARIESYEGREKKGISDVRRTFCLFVTFDLLFITLLWIIELNVKGGIETTLEKEVLHYDYSSSYFDIFLLAVFRFKVLILAYAMCRLRHWWAIADLMKTQKKNKTVKNRLYSKYEKAERKSWKEALGVWKLATESVADLLVELLTGEFTP